MFNSCYIQFGLLDPYVLPLKAHVSDLWKWDTIDPGEGVFCSLCWCYAWIKL